MKFARTIAAPVAAVAIIAGSTVGVAGVASAEPAMAVPAAAPANLEAFANDLGIYTTIGGFAGTAVGAAVGCLLLGGVAGTAGPAGSLAGCTTGAAIGGLAGTLIGGSFALPALVPEP